MCAEKSHITRANQTSSRNTALGISRFHAMVLIVCIAPLILSAPVHAQRAGQSATIRAGEVTSIRTVDLRDGNAVGGALVGGAFGAALSGTSSSSRSRNRNAALGALLGGAAASSQTRQGRIYTVSTSDGTMIQVATEQTEMRIGDCVFVEQSGGGTNIRRAPATACEPESRAVLADEDVNTEMQRDASICFSARQELADAEDDASFDRAARKVKLLCYD